MAEPRDTADEAPSQVTELGDPEALTLEEQRAAERRAHAALPLAFRIIDGVFNVLLGALLILLVGVVGANVAGRYLGFWSLPWADELARFTFVWVIFVGAALAHFRKEHIAVGYVVAKFSPGVVRAIGLVRETITLGVLAVILWGAWNVFATSPGRSALLGIPISWLNFSVPLAATLMVLMSVYRVWAIARATDDGRP